jgi:hypothetical protein
MAEEYTDYGVPGCQESRSCRDRLRSEACRRRFDANSGLENFLSERAGELLLVLRRIRESKLKHLCFGVDQSSVRERFLGCTRPVYDETGEPLASCHTSAPL